MSGPSGVGHVAAAFEALRAAERRDGTLPIAMRRDLLSRLKRSVIDGREEIVSAIDADFGMRSREETLIAEVLVVVEAIRHVRPRLARWSRARRVAVDLPFKPSKAWIVPQPLGVVGIISPWNYPFQLALLPLISAIAAGNRVALKPSEATPRTTELIARLLTDALGPDVAQTVIGDATVAEAFTRLPFDHILFTGSAATGRRVMAAAAQNLTPVTLELGGKCPAIVLPDADLDHAARAIVAGKGMNAGQTCVAPDTALLVGVDPERFEAALAVAARTMFPQGLRTAVISELQRARLARLGEGHEITRLAPVKTGVDGLGVTNVRPGSALAEEEAFGPLLGLETFADLDDALAAVRGRPSPLAVYVFTKDHRLERKILDATRAGALVVNGTVTQAAIHSLPFGGVGASGYGRHHGRAGFDTFSNPRVYLRHSRFALARLLDPPFTDLTRKILERLITR